jgi:hypothetical protein
MLTEFVVGIAYVEGKSYADGQTELHRGVSTSRVALDIDYVDGCPRYRLRRRPLCHTPRAVGRRRSASFL